MTRPLGYSAVATGASSGDVTAAITTHSGASDPHGDRAYADGKVAKSLVDAKGDLLVGTANDTVGRLAVGADGYLPYADSSQGTGLKWAPNGNAAIPADRGFLAWNCPPFGVSGSTALSTAGLLYLTRVRRVPAGNVTNLHIAVSVVGSGLTSGQCFAALFLANGTRVGVTADQSSAWATGVAVKTMAISGGPYVHAGGDVYVGWFYNGTTGPTLARFGAFSAMTNAGLSAGSYNSAVADTGLTTAMPSAIGTMTSASLEYWAAVS